MPARKTTTKTTENVLGVQKPSNLELTKIVHRFNDLQENFTDSIQKLEKYRGETIFHLDAEIQNKRQEFNELNEDFEKHRKRKQIEIENDILKDKFEAAKKFLEMHNQVPINKTELETLRNAKETYEKEMSVAVKKEKERGARNLTEALKNNDLAHKAEIAELKAQNNQQNIQISHLNSLLNKREEDVYKQIQLTKDVAEW